MLNHQACEDIIASCQSFSLGLESAVEIYKQLPEIIDTEHEVIRKRQVNEMEPIVKSKLSIGQALEAQINSLMDCVFKVREICERNLIETPKFDPKLTNAISFFESLLEEVEGVDLLKRQILERVLQKCRSGLSHFLKSVESTKGKIEVNKRLTADLLRYHQESIRFWQDLASESEATYNASGKRKTDHNSGVIKVGA